MQLVSAILYKLKPGWNCNAMHKCLCMTILNVISKKSPTHKIRFRLLSLHRIPDVAMRLVRIFLFQRKNQTSPFGSSFWAAQRGRANYVTLGSFPSLFRRLRLLASPLLPAIQCPVEHFRLSWVFSLENTQMSVFFVFLGKFLLA